MSVIDNSWSNQNRKTNNEPDSPTTFHPLKSVKALCTQGDTWRANLAQYLHSTFNLRILKCWANIHLYRPSQEIELSFIILTKLALKVWVKDFIALKTLVVKSVFPPSIHACVKIHKIWTFCSKLNLRMLLASLSLPFHIPLHFQLLIWPHLRNLITLTHVNPNEITLFT